MNYAANRYEKLKNAARRLMLAGEVDRYMHALRLMQGLRTGGPVGQA